MKKLIALLLLMPLSLAYVIHLVTPVNTYLEPLIPVEISPVGPGYRVVLAVDRNTPENFVWDNIDMETGPNWTVTYAKDYRYIYAIIEVPVDAEEGDYLLSFVVSDRNGDHVQEDSIVRITVTRNPNDLAEIGDLASTSLVAGNDSISFTVYNKALGEARYRIFYSIEGISKEYSKDVIIDPNTTKSVEIPINIPNEGFYNITVRVESLDTPIINKTMSRQYYVRPTLRSKLSSIRNAFPIVPINLAPFYAILGLFLW